VWFAGVDNLIAVIRQLECRIDKIESHIKVMEEKFGGVSPVTPSGASVAKVVAAAAAPAVKSEDVDEDDNMDLFGSDSEVRLMCECTEFR
jgi:hypothetical protein